MLCADFWVLVSTVYMVTVNNSNNIWYLVMCLEHNNNEVGKCVKKQNKQNNKTKNFYFKINNMIDLLKKETV